jgi:hypothetical protein
MNNIGGLSYEEIGFKLGLSRECVRVIFNKALLKMRHKATMRGRSLQGVNLRDYIKDERELEQRPCFIFSRSKKPDLFIYDNE